MFNNCSNSTSLDLSDFNTGNEDLCRYECIGVFKITYNANIQLLIDFEQSIVEQVQTTQTTDLQSILDEEIDN